jgi:branched-chain amino acid transport system substrate-binding protein
MRALRTIITACLVVFLTGGFSNPRTISVSLSDPQTPQGGLSHHPDSYRDSHVGFNNFDSPFEGGQGDVNSKNTIKIGLLIQNKNSVAAKNGAELAILNANSKGDKVIKFELVVRSMEGPWGTGSKQAVNLVFDEEVVAMLGSHDGRNAHLVEQVSAKSRVVFLSAWSGDPTLSQAFVPWFFNCVPNDLQQADALIEELYNKRRLTNITVVSDPGYDSQSLLRNFLKKVEMEGYPEPSQLSLDSTGKNINDLTEKILREDPGCVVLLLPPPASARIAEQLNLNHLNRPVFGTLTLLNEDLISGKDLKEYQNVNIVSSVNLSGEKGSSFSSEYKRKYGSLPGAVASYAYDGINILIEAVKETGTERENIQKAMAKIRYEGVTGTIQFDDKGNRKGIPVKP